MAGRITHEQFLLAYQKHPGNRKKVTEELGVSLSTYHYHLRKELHLLTPGRGRPKKTEEEGKPKSETLSRFFSDLVRAADNVEKPDVMRFLKTWRNLYLAGEAVKKEGL